MISKRIMISLPDGFLSEVDKIAKIEDRSRSELIRQALRRYMNDPNENYKETILELLK